MCMADLGGEAIGKVSPQELVAVLERLEPDAATRLDVDAIGRAIDPRLFGRDDLANLLPHLDRLTAADLGQMRPQTFARLISRANEVRGDLAFAAGLTGLFDLPRA
jgi:hypothetical protein